MLGAAPIAGAPLGAIPASATASLEVTATESVVLAPSTLAGGVFSAAASDTLDAADAAAAGALYALLVAEAWGINDSAADPSDLMPEVIETAAFGAANAVALGLATREGFRLEDVLSVVRGINAPTSESIGTSDLISAMYGVTLLEQLRLAGVVHLNQRAGLLLAEACRLADAVRAAEAAVASESVALTLDVQAQTALRVIEALGITGTGSGAATYNISVLQAVRLADNLTQFFGAEASETIELTTTLLERARLFASASGDVSLDASVTPQLLVSVVAAEDVEFTATQLVQMIYQPTVIEGVDISVGYIAPDGSFTTWAVNTRTGATTEYRDYTFNSFARVGNHYLGASESGLYRLLGDDDDGEAIIASIRGGYMQFGGPRLSRLAAAYIATRGEGDFVLKILTGDGLSYNYAVATRNMRSTKVHMGKGQRARYFAFELIGDGTDFDLDTLEFVPIVVQRRV